MQMARVLTWMCALQGRRLLAVGVPAPAPGPLSAVAAANASLYTGWTASFGDGDGVVNLVSLRTCERCA